jgi:hypothetical protein
LASKKLLHRDATPDSEALFVADTQPIKFRDQAGCYIPQEGGFYPRSPDVADCRGCCAVM